MELALVGVGTAIGALGQISSARQQASAMEARAKIEQQNSFEKAAAQRQVRDRQLSTLRTRIAKSGASLQGSPLESMVESIYNTEMDIASGITSAQNNASLLRAEASATRQSGFTGGVATLLKGAGKYATTPGNLFEGDS